MATTTSAGQKTAEMESPVDADERKAAEQLAVAEMKKTQKRKGLLLCGFTEQLSFHRVMMKKKRMGLSDGVGLLCFAAEIWFGLYWILSQALYWNPVYSFPLTDRLSDRCCIIFNIYHG
ncbi:hypothetical protein Droror1_Dr00016281 [Drosera rotundifolia]